MGMRTLILADRAPEVSLKTVIAEQGIEAVITCGDLRQHDLRELASISIPKFGVYGNHCHRGYLDQLGIVDLHGKGGILPNGMIAVGVEGCVRYKDEPDILYTQEEYEQILRPYPWSADVVVTHAPPAGVNDHDDPAHVGIVALRRYVDVIRPRYLLHGHTYPDRPAERLGNTTVIYTHGVRIATL